MLLWWKELRIKLAFIVISVYIENLFDQDISLSTNADLIKVSFNRKIN